jgi:hypothetical protein
MTGSFAVSEFVTPAPIPIPMPPTINHASRLSKQFRQSVMGFSAYRRGVSKRDARTRTLRINRLTEHRKQHDNASRQQNDTI